MICVELQDLLLGRRDLGSPLLTGCTAEVQQILLRVPAAVAENQPLLTETCSSGVASHVSSVEHERHLAGTEHLQPPFIYLSICSFHTRFTGVSSHHLLAIFSSV